MAIRSGFFNSVNGDRKYDARRFAEYFASFIGNGVFPNPSTNLQVVAQTIPDMTVIVRPGKVWINGYIMINDDDYILQLDPADGVLNRIDRVVARYDVEDREIRIEIKKGTFAITPEPPSLQRDADAYELALADIYVAAGTVSITQANITDLRLNTELCGIVHGTVEQVDTTTLFNQYLAWLQEKKSQYNQDMLAWTAQKKSEFESWAEVQEQGFEAWRSQEEQYFYAWFEHLQDILDENVAGNLLNLIESHKDDGTQHAKTARFVIGTSTAGWTEKDCDYLCDGTNDQEEINNAITALPASGGEIVILDGTYNITAKINVNKNNVSIRGNGNATVLKRMWDSSSAEGVITLTSAKGCRVQNLQINGNKANYSSVYNYGIYLYASSDNTVTGNTCNNNNRCGILLLLSSNNTVTGNTCNNNYYGIYLDSSSNNTVTGNTCYNNSDRGIYIYASSNDNTVTGNTCNNNYYGIYLYESSDNNTVTGNTCYNNSIGIRLNSSSNNTVTGNTCNNNSNYGIFLYPSSNNTVTGNTCNNNSYGINLTSSSNNTVTGNTCNNNSYGILLSSSSNNNTVTGNTCNNNNYGILLSSSSNNTVTGNTCIRGTGQTSDYTSDQYTIRLQGTFNNYNLISSNNCMGKAVVIEGGTGNSVWGNKFDATNDLS